MFAIPTFHEIASRERRVHVHNGDTYVSFGTILDPNPPSTELYKFKYPHHCNAQTQWFTDKYPFMGFCMVNPSWSGLFGCLHGTKHTFPIILSGGLYCLDPSIQDKWWKLEQSIIGVTQHILDHYPNVPHPLDMELYSFPRTWGYLRSHGSLEAARMRILNSRDAFIPLMALFTYAIALSQTYSITPPNTTPHWVQYLDRTTRVDSEWISQLAQHPFSNPVYVRTGVYINWPTFMHTNILQYCVRFRVQVWIRLPGSIPHSFRNMLPVLDVTPAEFAEAKADLVRRRNAPITRPARALRADQNSTPRTRQLEGESLQSFFERMTAALMRRVVAETPGERDARLKRDLLAVKFQCPGQNGPYVFEWQETPRGLKRVYIPRNQVPEVWDSYATSQKVYSGLYNEWDLCRQFDPDAVIADDDDDDDDDEDANLHGPFTDHDPQASGGIDVLTQSIMEDTYPLTDPVSTKDLHIPSIDDVLYHTYGFHPDGNSYSTPTECLDPKLIPRILVETGSAVTSNRATQVIHFISTLVKGSQFVPAALHDLNRDNADRLLGSISIIWRKLDDGLFAVRYTQSSSPLQLLLPSSSHVVQTFRLPHCTRLHELALAFCSKGARFFYGELDNGGNPFVSAAIPVSGLGFRRHGFKPNGLDYQAYVSRRAGLLSDPAVARAALMEGGIIWRLTVDTLHEMHGTIDFASFFTEDVESAHLTEHDRSVIVGLYRVWTGDANIDKYLSWWPQRHTWYRGGYNVEQWTSACEAWYQNRIRGLQSSSYDAKGATEWEKSFNLFKLTRHLRRNNELACNDFLSRLSS